MLKLMAVPIVVLGFSGVASNRGEPVARETARARALALISAVNSARLACNLCGTDDRCSSTNYHDIWTSGGGDEMTGSVHECQTGSCEGDGHKPCQGFASTLGGTWLDDLVAAVEAMDPADATLLGSSRAGRVSVDLAGRFLQVEACSRILAHVPLKLRTE
jgi:hypothetical protein